MGTIRVASDVAFRAFASIFAAEWKHITTVTTPICSNIGESLETMWNPMIDFLLVALLRIGGLDVHGSRS